MYKWRREKNSFKCFC